MKPCTFGRTTIRRAPNKAEWIVTTEHRHDRDSSGTFSRGATIEEAVDRHMAWLGTEIKRAAHARLEGSTIVATSLALAEATSRYTA